MKKTIKRVFIVIIVIAIIFSFFIFTGWRMGRSLDHYIDVEYSDIISEYPELAVTVQDKDWIASLIQSQNVQQEIQNALTDEEYECVLNLSNVGAEYNYLFPKNECSITISNSGKDALIRISFEPVVRTEKIIQFSYIVFYETDYDFWKQAVVYKGTTQEEMSRDRRMATYNVFDSESTLVDVPAFGIYWADMTVFEIPLPRAEILG